MSFLDKVQHGKSFTPPRILVYGYEGCGKSTFAAGAPKAIFIPTEDGIGQIDCYHFPLAKSFADVMSDINDLVTENHDFQTVVIDSLSALERIIHTEVCKKFSVRSIEQADGGYGKGYKFAIENFWLPFIHALDACHDKGMMIILTAHVGTFTVQNPEGSYDRTGPLLHKTARDLLHQWTDCTLLAEQKGRITEKNGQTVVSALGKDGGDRVIRCIGSIGTIAKNRYKLPMEMPLDFQAFLNAISGAMTDTTPEPEKEASNG